MLSHSNHKRSRFPSRLLAVESDTIKVIIVSLVMLHFAVELERAGFRSYKYIFFYENLCKVDSFLDG